MAAAFKKTGVVLLVMVAFAVVLVSCSRGGQSEVCMDYRAGLTFADQAAEADVVGYARVDAAPPDSSTLQVTVVDIRRGGDVVEPGGVVSILTDACGAEISSEEMPQVGSEVMFALIERERGLAPNGPSAVIAYDAEVYDALPGGN